MFLKTVFLVALFLFAFESVAQPATVLRPKLGEKIQVGSTYTLRWEQSDPTIQMILKLSTDGGMTQEVISQRIPQGQFTYDWTVPSDFSLSDSCLLFVCIYYAQGIYGESDFFSLVGEGGSTKIRKPAMNPTPSRPATGVFTVNGRRLVRSPIERLLPALSVTCAVRKQDESPSENPRLLFVK